MGWERRGNSRVYYRKIWRNGTCTSEYVGAGIYGAFAAEQDEGDRQEAQAQCEAWRRELAEQAATDRQIDELGRMVRDYASTVLQACGYHQHKRGEWRKKRMNEVTPELRAQANEIHTLFQRTREKKLTAGDLTVLRALLKVPDMAALYGDLAGLVLKAMLINFNGSPVFKESATAHIEHLKNGLGYEASTGLERMLIDQVIITWVRLYKLEMCSSEEYGASVPAVRLEFWERILSSAQGRHLRAIEALARVRRLLHLRASVQINVGDQQFISIP